MNTLNGTWRLLKLQNWQIKAGILDLPRLTNLAVSYHCSQCAGLLVKNAATWKKHNCYCLGCRAEWWKAKLSPYCLIISPPVPWVICIVVTWQIKAVLEVTVYKWLVLQTADGGYHREQERYREWEREKKRSKGGRYGVHTATNTLPTSCCCWIGIISTNTIKSSSKLPVNKDYCVENQ